MRHPFRQLRQIQLDDRQRVRFVVPEDADVDLAPLDVLLDQRRTVEPLLEEGDALHQLAQRLNDRAGVDADRAVLAGGLDDQGKLEIVGMVELAPVRDREARRADVVEVEDLFGHRLVLREKESLRTRARVTQVEQLEERRDVRFLRVVAGERFHHVEDEIGLRPGQREQRSLVPQLVEERLVSVLAQRLHHLLAIELLAALDAAPSPRARTPPFLVAHAGRIERHRGVVARLVEDGDLQHQCSANRPRVR